MRHKSQDDYLELAKEIKNLGYELGFQAVGITNTKLEEDEIYLKKWLEAGHHGEMGYMQQHGTKRTRPNELEPGTISVISTRMDYAPPDAEPPAKILNDNNLAYISRYAVGRDYHKLIRKRLQSLATQIENKIGQYGYRCYVDSAPVLEKALARNAGLGWIGKHTNLIHPKAGSWFFLGEIYTDLPLPYDNAFDTNHCGTCSACLDVCPTQAIIAPYKVDARRCISYHTIELRSAIPVEFRKAMGNRIYGCDDCQLVCPWNKFSQNTEEKDFRVRHGLDSPELIALFAWTEAEFLQRTEGSAIRRIGYECWLRNIAVALGNASTNEQIIDALNSRLNYPSELVKEHVKWALEQHA